MARRKKEKDLRDVAKEHKKHKTKQKKEEKEEKPAADKGEKAKKKGRKKDIILLSLLTAIIIILILPWIGASDSAVERRSALRTALEELGERETVTFSTGDRSVFFVKEKGTIIMDVPLAQLTEDEQEKFLGIEEIRMTKYTAGDSYRFAFPNPDDAVNRADSIFTEIFGKTAYYSAAVTTNMEEE